jgi:DNA-binding PadR family transcriptional regulator
MYTITKNMHMGLLDRKKEENLQLTTPDLQKIKERITDQKIEKNESTPPPKLVKTDFVGTSNNTSDSGNLEMKLIKILNELENIKAKVDEDSQKVIVEVKNVYSDVENVSELVKEIPKEMLAEMRNMKKNMPAVYDDIKQSVGQHLRSKVIGAIDSNILKIINQAGRINSTDLLAKAEATHVCSKNTLYVHLSRLEEEGYLVRKREMHEVYYVIPENVKETLPKEESVKLPPIKEEHVAKEEPKQEAPKDAPKQAPRAEERRVIPKEEPAKVAAPPKEEAAEEPAASQAPAEAAPAQANITTPPEPAPKKRLFRKSAKPKEPAEKESK